MPVVESTFTVNALSINGTPYTIGKDFNATGGMETKNISASDIIFIGYGIGADNYNDYTNIDLTGKVVAYINANEPMIDGKSKVSGTDKLSDWSTNRTKRIQFIQSKKPALILAINPVAVVRRNSGARMSLKRESTTIPASVYTISAAIADELLKSSGKTFADLKSAIDQSGTPQTQTVKAAIETSYAGTETPVKAVDVVGLLPGSDPKLKDEVLVISAHYDHIGLNPPGSKDMVNNGADDDGSGTTGILEIASLCQSSKRRVSATPQHLIFR